MSKILVIGGTGCLGSSIARKLVENGSDVRIFAVPGTWHPILDGLDIEKSFGDIRNKKDLRKAMSGCELVYNVAGIVSYYKIDSERLYEINYIGVKNVLDVAAELGIKRVVTTCSSAGVGIAQNEHNPINENEEFKPEWKKVMYMYSKHLAIKACAEAEGVESVAASPTTVYGQGDITMHIGRLVKGIKDGSISIAAPGGNAVVSVDDVTDAHILLMEKGVHGENYLVASENMTYKELYNQIAELVGVKRIDCVESALKLKVLRFVNSIWETVLMWFGKKPKNASQRIAIKYSFRYFDSSKIRLLGWSPKVSFKESIRKALDYYEKHGMM